MSIGSGIFALLKASDAVTEIVGGRIFPVLLPEGVTLPAVTYQIVGGTSMPTFETSGMQKVRIQFDCFTDTKSGGYKVADELRDVVRQLLNGYQGTFADDTVIQNIDLIQTTDYYEEYPRQFRCMAEFYLYFDFNS